jgi:hypothetical protein
MCYANGAVRDAYASWLHAHEFDLAVTVNPNRPLRWDTVARVVLAMDGRLNRRFVGAKFVKKSELERVGFVAVAERTALAEHVHCALRIRNDMSVAVKQQATADALQTLLKVPRDGRRFLPAASIDVRPCDQGWIDYILKNVDDESFVYVRGLPRFDEFQTEIFR